MEQKPKIKPTETIVFSEDDLEDYDELSITRAMRDASGTIKNKLAQDFEEASLGEDDELDFESLNAEE